MKTGELIILTIGIEICLNCPYPDCISTDTDLCHLMKDEVARVRVKAESEKRKREDELLTNIQSVIDDNGGGLTTAELRDKLGYGYREIETLRRNGKLSFEKKQVGKKVSIVITGNGENGRQKET